MAQSTTDTTTEAPGTAGTDAGDVALQHRRLQHEQQARDREAAKAQASAKEAGAKAVQAGHRPEPENPMPAQQLQKPGLESEMDLQPRFMASGYLGSGKLDGMTALVTGGDSGIGRAVAVLFAREGADLAIVYLAAEQADAEETRRHVEAEGRRCVLIPGDVRDPRFCERAVRDTVDTYGRLDVLVNNAAFQLHAAKIEDISNERLELTLRTNVFGYFQMARAAVPHLPRGGSIINTGSVTGLEGEPELLDYATTKGAIHAFTKSLASNLLARGIRVNAVAPGPVWTPLNPSDRPAEQVKDFGKHTDMKRPAQPEELSPAYVFLAAPCCASYITGIVLPVTGSVGAV